MLAPAFDRSIEQPVAGAIAVPPEAGLVVTEGNYLLLDEPRWRAVRAELDEVWHVRVDEVLRLERLVARHVRVRQESRRGPGLGRPGRPAQRRLVEAAAARADRVLDLTDWQPPAKSIVDAPHQLR